MLFIILFLLEVSDVTFYAAMLTLVYTERIGESMENAGGERADRYIPF